MKKILRLMITLSLVCAAVLTLTSCNSTKTPEYIMTFTNYGRTIKTETFKENERIKFSGAVPESEAEGFAFSGWDISNSHTGFGAKYFRDEALPIAKDDYILEARYSPIHTLTFLMDDEPYFKVSDIEGAEIDYKGTNFDVKKEGFEFKGWIVVLEEGEIYQYQKVYNISSYFPFATMLNRDLKLQASFELAQ